MIGATDGGRVIAMRRSAEVNSRLLDFCRESSRHPGNVDLMATRGKIDNQRIRITDSATDWTNWLFYGDNLEILHNNFADESVDLIYLDPPFQSGASYNHLFKEESGAKAHAQVEAFADTWEWNDYSIEAYGRLIQSHDQQTARTIGAMNQILGPSNMLSYLVMMAERLLELRRVLKPTGSIYLHCDPTASHYLKIIMDSIFGAENFLNEVVWMYGLGGSSKRYWPRKHDIIFWYSKEKDKHYFDPAMVPAKSNMMKGKLKKAPDYWDIPSINNMSKERLGYPTQKPLQLLTRIVESSCPPGGLVLDPFCGCGTAVEAAQHLDRRWCGIDITALAIDLVSQRMTSRFPNGMDSGFQITGLPQDVEGARMLFERSPLQFEQWAVMQLGGAPNKVQVGDRGIDGKILLATRERGVYETALVSVKGSKVVNPSMVRDLVGTMTREEAAYGVLLTFEPPTRGMLKEAQSAGPRYSDWYDMTFPRIQFITVEELLDGKRPQLPPAIGQSVKPVRADENVESLTFFDD